jgi:hypothetical protein
MANEWYDRLGVQIAVGAVGFLGLSAIFLLLADGREALQAAKTYESVHQMPIEEYVQRGQRSALYCAVVPLVAALRWLDGRRAALWSVLALLVLLGLVITVPLALVSWARTGFDH